LAAFLAGFPNYFFLLRFAFFRFAPLRLADFLAPLRLADFARLVALRAAAGFALRFLMTLRATAAAKAFAFFRRFLLFFARRVVFFADADFPVLRFADFARFEAFLAAAGFARLVFDFFDFVDFPAMSPPLRLDVVDVNVAAHANGGHGFTYVMAILDDRFTDLDVVERKLVSEGDVVDGFHGDGRIAFHHPSREGLPLASVFDDHDANRVRWIVHQKLRRHPYPSGGIFAVPTCIR
jgi:hypothetical protein